METYDRFTPVSVTPLVSFTVAVSDWVKFWLTETGAVLALFEGVRTIDAGGQVEKKPAELPAFERLELMIVDPGSCAVARPFWSIDTMVESCGV